MLTSFEELLMATVTAPSAEPNERFLVRGLAWYAYRRVWAALQGRHLRLTYDRGNLELMTISRSHGSYSRLLGRFVFVLAEEFTLPISSCGDMTCDREDLDRGLEPDESFYIVNEALVRDKDEIDLTVDPPPDLALEIDISRSSRNRLAIYAAMRVPEVWQWNAKTLRVWRLGADGEYASSDVSQYFPGIAIQELAHFLHRRAEVDEVSLVAEFRTWVRKQFGKE